MFKKTFWNLVFGRHLTCGCASINKRPPFRHHYAKRVLEPFELRVKWRHFQIHGMRPVTGGLGEKNKIQFRWWDCHEEKPNIFSIISHQSSSLQRRKKYFPSRPSLTKGERKRKIRECRQRKCNSISYTSRKLIRQKVRWPRDIPPC